MKGGTPIVETREIVDTDLARVTEIYNHYVDNTVITFEEQRVDEQEMGARVQELKRAAWPWLVACHDGLLVGYAYASQWRPRSAYRFAAESTIYLDPKALGQGFGLGLYQELLQILQAKGVRTVIGVVGLPNQGSVALHEKLGFAKAAHLSKVGFKFERWLDVGYWQKQLV